MISIWIANTLLTVLATVMWRFTNDPGPVFLIGFCFIFMQQGWAKKWIRENDKDLEKVRHRLEIAPILTWGIIAAYVATSAISGISENLLLIKPVLVTALLVVTFTSHTSYILVAHNLYNSVYPGFRAVRNAVAASTPVRIFYSALCYTAFFSTVQLLTG